MNRPTACVWAVFGDRLDFVAVEVFGRKNAVLVVIDLEQDDRRHQGASEVPGVALSEAEFVRHVFCSRVCGDHSPLDRRPSGPAGTAIIAMAKP